MNKSLITLAVLGAFAGVASAQSSVTIYGVIDLGIAKSNGGSAGNSAGGDNGALGVAGNSPATNGTAGTGKAWTMQQGSTSRLGFRGNEDLGGGLSTQFQLEHRFVADTGTAQSAAIFWNGRSYLQLTSATAGGVYLGRDYTPAFWTALKSDPFGWDGVGQMGAQMWAGFFTPAQGGNPYNVRTANTVGYKSPKISGLSAQVAVALGEGSVGRDTGFNVEYADGPIYAGLAYERVNKAGSVNDTNAKDGDSLFNIAFAYNFGVVKPMFYYARANDASTNSVNKFYSLGLQAPLGGGTVKALYYRLNPSAANIAAYNQSYLGTAPALSNAVPAQNPNYLQNTRKFAIGYDYFLSKRTNLYGDVGLTRADTKTNNSTYSFGLKHTF